MAPALITDGCTPAVYVFDGAGVAPDDVDGAGVEPVTSAFVVLDAGSGTFRYVAAFLPAGDYTAAFTCDAGADDPDLDDTLVFTGTASVTVTAQQATTLDFSD